MCDTTCSTTAATAAYNGAKVSANPVATDMTRVLELLSNQSYRRQTQDTTQDSITAGATIRKTLEQSIYNDIKAMSGTPGYSEPTTPTDGKNKSILENYINILKNLYNAKINRDSDV